MATTTLTVPSYSSSLTFTLTLYLVGATVVYHNGHLATLLSLLV